MSYTVDEENGIRLFGCSYDHGFAIDWKVVGMLVSLVFWVLSLKIGTMSRRYKMLSRTWFLDHGERLDYFIQLIVDRTHRSEAMALSISRRESHKLWTIGHHEAGDHFVIGYYSNWTKIALVEIEWQNIMWVLFYDVTGCVIRWSWLASWDYCIRKG